LTINNLPRFIESLPDWKILNGCFPGTSAAFKPTDIDGCINRKGVCLFLEHKLPGSALKLGQRITFKALAKQGNTVIVFWGRDEDINAIEIFYGTTSKRKDATLQDLRDAVTDWFQSAK